MHAPVGTTERDHVQAEHVAASLRLGESGHRVGHHLLYFRRVIGPEGLPVRAEHRRHVTVPSFEAGEPQHPVDDDLLRPGAPVGVHRVGAQVVLPPHLPMRVGQPGPRQLGGRGLHRQAAAPGPPVGRRLGGRSLGLRNPRRFPRRNETGGIGPHRHGNHPGQHEPRPTHHRWFLLPGGISRRNHTRPACTAIPGGGDSGPRGLLACRTARRGRLPPVQSGGNIAAAPGQSKADKQATTGKNADAPKTKKRAPWNPWAESGYLVFEHAGNHFPVRWCGDNTRFRVRAKPLPVSLRKKPRRRLAGSVRSPAAARTGRRRGHRTRGPCRCLPIPPTRAPGSPHRSARG